jgi:hypothetical protein
MSGRSLPIEQRLIRWAIPFIMLGLLIKVLLMPVEPVNWDSNYYLNIGSNYIERGELTPYMWRLGADTTIIAGSGTGYGVLLLNGWLKLFGLSLYSGYALMYLCGILSLIVLYFLARDWWQSRTAALVAVVYTALAGSFIAQFYIRMDALGILTYLLVLLLHLYAVRSERNWLHFVVGVALIVGAEIHMSPSAFITCWNIYSSFARRAVSLPSHHLSIILQVLSSLALSICLSTLSLTHKPTLSLHANVLTVSQQGWSKNYSASFSSSSSVRQKRWFLLSL